MIRYSVTWYKKNLMSSDEKLSGPYKFNVNAENLEAAALRAASEIVRNSIRSTTNDAWDATVYGPNKEEYEILRKGAWLINLVTGKQLEERVLP